jgi:phosphoribosyl-AMP cyclohydrolase
VGAACHTGDRTCFDADVLLAPLGGPASDAPA